MTADVLILATPSLPAEGEPSGSSSVPSDAPPAPEGVAAAAPSIPTDEQVWELMGEYAAHQEAIARRKREYDEQEERIRTFRDAEVAKHQFAMDAIAARLQPWADREIATNPLRRKSAKHAAGTAKWTNSTASVAIEDRDAFIQWAKTNGHGDWVRVKEEPDISAVKAAATTRVGQERVSIAVEVSTYADGVEEKSVETEIIPGLKVEWSEPRFVVTPNVAPDGGDAE